MKKIALVTAAIGAVIVSLRWVGRKPEPRIPYYWCTEHTVWRTRLPAALLLPGFC